MPRRLPQRLAALLRREDGVAMVEFAFAAPVLFSMLFGIMQFGQALWIRNSLQYAAFVAGRYAMAHASATVSDLTQQVDSAASGLSTASITVNVTTSTVGSTDYVTITATYPFTFLTSYLPYGTVTLSAESRVPLS